MMLKQRKNVTDFVTDEKAGDIFNGKLTAEEIITNMMAYLQMPLEVGKTLILFDKMQECSQVRLGMRWNLNKKFRVSIELVLFICIYV